MAYRNVNKIICGKLNVNLCPSILSSNSDVCGCFQHYYHQSIRNFEGKLAFRAEVKQFKGNLMYKKNLHPKDLHKFSLTTFAFGGRPCEIIHKGHNYATDSRVSASRRQSEGSIKVKSQSANKIALRSQYKSEINTSSTQRTGDEDKFKGTVKLKYNPNMLRLPEKLTPKGLTHQFNAPKKSFLVANLKEELLSMDDKVNRKLGIIKPSVASLLGIEKSPQDSISSRAAKAKTIIPSPINPQPFSSFVRGTSNKKKSTETSPKNSQNLIQPIGHITKLEEIVPKHISGNQPANRAAKYAFQHLAFKSNKENSTFRKVLSRNFYSKSRANPALFRLKRDLISPDVNEMHVRHHYFKKQSFKTNNRFQFHKLDFISQDNAKNGLESRLSASY